MAIEIIDVGNVANDGTGDPLRTAFQKVNNNFAYIQLSSSNIADAVTLDDAPDQAIFTYAANAFTQGLFQIKSYNEDNNDSQQVLITAQLSNDGTEVKFSGMGSTFFGNNLCTYDMSVNSGNVELTVSPLVDEVLNHFISYQVTWTGSLGLGAPLISEGDAGLITEYGNASITTEG